MLTIGPHVAQQQLIQSRSCFSVTMASRFEIVYEEYIEELKDQSGKENTKNSTEWRKNVFKEWATERNLRVNLEENDVLDQRQTVAVLSIQKFDNFALYLINK